MISSSEGGHCVGIDLGSAYSCVWATINGKLQAINDGYGNRSTPSVISFTQNQTLFGEAAKNCMLQHEQASVCGFRNFLGRKGKELVSDDEITRGSSKVRKGPDQSTLFELTINGKNKTLTPRELVTMQLNYLKKNCESFLGEAVKKAVLTVPAYFWNEQRIDTKQAAVKAGIQVLRVINQPTSACLAYGMHTSKEERNVVVFDMGATLDVTVLAVDEGIFEVLGTARNIEAGGHKIDEILFNFCKENFLHTKGVSIEDKFKAKRRLITQCQRAKKILSVSESAFIEVDFLADGLDFIMGIQRQKFEELCMPVFNQIVSCLQASLKNAGISKSSVNDIILSGGCSHIPKVQSILREFFQREKLSMEIDPSQVVACGAAVQAELLCPSINSKKDTISGFIEVNPLSLGVRTDGDLMTIVVPCNSTLPGKFSKIFTNAIDNQLSMVIHILEGQRPYFGDNYHRGSLKLQRLTPLPRGLAEVEVTFDINQYGVLRVSAQDMMSPVLNSASTVCAAMDRWTAQDIEEIHKTTLYHDGPDCQLRQTLQCQNYLLNYISYVKACLASESVKMVMSPVKLTEMATAVKDCEKYMQHRKRPFQRNFSRQNQLMLSQLFSGIHSEVEEKAGAGADWSGLREWRNRPSIGPK